MFILHFLGGGDADDREGDRDHAAHTVGQQQPRLQHPGLRALDAAARVEAVAAGGQLRGGASGSTQKGTLARQRARGGIFWKRPAGSGGPEMVINSVSINYVYCRKR